MGHIPDVPATSGIQVLDRAVYILSVIASQPRNLTELCEATGLPRATAHRIAVALEKHRLIERTPTGQWATGPALIDMAPSTNSRIEEAAAMVLPELMQSTGESVQVYRLSGLERVCIANAEPPSGLRDTVPVGHRMTLAAGSAAKILVAFSSPALREQVLPTAAYTRHDLDEIRAAGISESIAERDPALGSASVPVFDASGQLTAALSISGPVDRMGHSPAARFGSALKACARQLESYLA
ncbi:MAG TPA: IclR family transcriptional regulator [Candidatus Corynebacterium gallistercoris]|uniref:IclR family transcriptional regulator n=1 Tax=Candidatus Corynebacterium gallistercoris TaxID=2838530 RepID=A0A9D1S1M6_9CORY|nr:IclR family transcriptional regulator [Candidatus Corynebacterium gallistercoris]